MTNNIVNIEIDIIKGGVNIAIDRAQTSVGYLAYGIIAGALKAYYTHKVCKRIAELLAVSANISKSVEVTPNDIDYIAVANRIYMGVRALFDGFPEQGFEVKRCCKYIINELAIPACPIEDNDEVK